MNIETIIAAVGTLIFVALIVWRAAAIAPLGWQDRDGWHAGEEPIGIGGGEQSHAHGDDR